MLYNTVNLEGRTLWWNCVIRLYVRCTSWSEWFVLCQHDRSKLQNNSEQDGNNADKSICQGHTGMWLLLTNRHIQVKSHVWQLIGHVILLTLSTHVLPDVHHPAYYLTLRAITCTSSVIIMMIRGRQQNSPASPPPPSPWPFLF